MLAGMSARDREVSASQLADTKQAKAKRRRWPDALKRELVVAAMAPGASVSIIARRHDVNANQLFKWCRQFGKPAASAEPAGIFSGGDRATAVGAIFGSDHDRRPGGSS